MIHRILVLIFCFNAHLNSAKDVTDNYIKSNPKGNTLDKGSWEKLKDGYRYSVPKKKKERKKQRKISKPNFQFGTMPWLNTLFYGLAFALIAGVLYWLWRSGYFGRFNNSARKLMFNVNEEPDDIDDLILDPLLEAAIREGDFRLAMRLKFLHLLQILNRQKRILWKKENTNRIYFFQLEGTGIQRHFKESCVIYEKAWYSRSVVGSEDFRILNDLVEGILSNAKTIVYA